MFFYKGFLKVAGEMNIKEKKKKKLNSLCNAVLTQLCNSSFYTEKQIRIYIKNTLSVFSKLMIDER